MRLYRRSLPALLVCLAGAGLFLSGCGAGSVADDLGSSATVNGKLASRDGSVTDLAGVELTVLDADEAATTNAAGDFQLRVRAHERVRIRVKDPRAAGTSTEEGDVVEIDPLDDDEICEIEVEIVDGEVVESCVDREGDEEHEAEWHGAMRLVPPKDAANQEAVGEASITCTKDGCRVVIEVFGLDGPAIYEAVLDHPTEGQESLGLIEVSAEGDGELVFEHALDDPLPFGVESVKDLLGTKLLVLDDLGETVLKGLFPGDGARDDDKDEEEAWTLADGTLEAPETGPEPNAVGWVLLKCKADCCVLVIEVGELETTSSLTVVVVDAEGSEASLGVFEIDAVKGSGRFAHEGCEELPFEAATLADLQGYELRLVDGEGRTVLAGEIPTFEE